MNKKKTAMLNFRIKDKKNINFIKIKINLPKTFTRLKRISKMRFNKLLKFELIFMWFYFIRPIPTNPGWTHFFVVGVQIVSSLNLLFLEMIQIIFELFPFS